MEVARATPATLEPRHARAARAARPTAVNLALGRRARVRPRRGAGGAERGRAPRRRRSTPRRTRQRRRSPRHGADLLAGARRILTHCNTGALATGGEGSALGVIRELAAPRRRRGARLRDAPAAAGRPADRLGAGARRHPASTLVVDGAAAGPDAPRRGRCGDRRLRPRGRQRRRRQQGRHVRARAGARAPRASRSSSPARRRRSTPRCRGGDAIEIEERDADEVRRARRRARHAARRRRCATRRSTSRPAELVTALGDRARRRAAAEHRGDRGAAAPMSTVLDALRRPSSTARSRRSRPATAATRSWTPRCRETAGAATRAAPTSWPSSRRWWDGPGGRGDVRGATCSSRARRCGPSATACACATTCTSPAT